MLFSVTVACLGYMAGSGRPVGLAARSCVSMKKTVEDAEPAERVELNIALNSIVEFQVRAQLLDDTAKTTLPSHAQLFLNAQMLDPKSKALQNACHLTNPSSRYS